jgi:two-component system nitrogen regulation sensor histidine kinase GlnL
VVKGMAHEVKNPLGGIRGAAQLMARKFEDRELDEYANIIISEVDRLQALVDRMLGPRESLDKRSINIHEVTERVRQLIEAEALDSVKVTRDYDPSLPEFLADSDQLTQAILNIVRNALEAAEAGSQITIKTRSRRQFTLNGQRHKLVCAIDIIDDGPGIPDDLMTSIFLPMVTSRPEGSGLGLSIAQLILTRHGGVIQAISQPGNTCFTLLLPMEQ